MFLGQLKRQVSIRMVEPTLSFHSMENYPDKNRAPIRSTHTRHIAKLEKFLKGIDSEKLEKAVHWKRCDDLLRRI